MFVHRIVHKHIIRKADDEDILERLKNFVEEHYGIFAAAVFAAMSHSKDNITTSAVAEVMEAYRAEAENYGIDDTPTRRTSAPNNGRPPLTAEKPIPIEYIFDDKVVGNIIDELVKAFEDDDIQTVYESALSHGIASVSDDLKLPPPNQIQRLLPAPSFYYDEFYERWCSKHCGELIIEISDEQRENVRQIINNALQNGHSVDMAAKEIRRTVGLTERQTWANIRYSDRMYEELRKTNPNMSSAELRKIADRAADKYAQTQRRKRSIDIARTELAKAQMQASLEYIKWAQELGLIQYIHGEWVTSGKSNVCSVCRELNHKVVDLTKDPLPPLHPRCACGIRFVSGNAESEISELRGVKPSDYAQYIRYRDRLGEDIVGNIDNFIEIIYNNNSEKWAELKEAYRYVNAHEGAKYEHYLIFSELKDMGINIGTVLPNDDINVYILKDENAKRDPYHIMRRMKERNITDDEVREYKDKAKIKFSQWNGTRYAYYSNDGVSIITKSPEQWVFKTTWRKEDFDEQMMMILEVVNKYV